MDKREALKIIEDRKINLQNAGIKTIPAKTASIYTFDYTKSPDPANLKPGEQVEVIGLLGTRDEYIIETDYRCASFFVHQLLSTTYWFRDYFDEVLELIEALRICNGYYED